MTTNRWMVVILIILALQVTTSLRLVMSTTELTAEVARVMQHVDPPGSVRTLDIKVDTSRAYLGNIAAPVQMVIFSDFECPACAMMARQIPLLLERYGDSLCISYRNFPLSSHSQARTLAELGESARLNGQFWSFHDSVFANQGALNKRTLSKLSRSLGFSMKSSESLNLAIDKDLALADKLDIKSTPTIFINGRRVIGAYPMSVLEKIIDEELQSPMLRPVICDE